MAVTSNKFQEGTEYLIRRFFPDIQFVAILGNRPGWPLKPSPEIVSEVLSRAGVAADDALVLSALDALTDDDALANKVKYQLTKELYGQLKDANKYYS